MFNFFKLKDSFKYAFAGLVFSFKHNQNIKIHLIIAFLVLLFSFLLGLTRYELYTVGLLIVLVISAEMINTSLEEVVNLLVNEHRQEAKIAKDVGAGMVLLITIFAVLVGLFIFVPHILSLFW